MLAGSTTMAGFHVAHHHTRFMDRQWRGAGLYLSCGPGIQGLQLCQRKDRGWSVMAGYGKMEKGKIFQTSVFFKSVFFIDAIKLKDY